MRAVHYEDVDRLSLREAEPVPLGAGDVLLAVEACGICGSDVASLLQGHYVEPGQVLGHEMSATVLEMGAELASEGTLEVGTRVAVRPARACGRCSYCRDGAPQLCGQSRARTLGYGAPGGYADAVLVRDVVVGADVLPVPADVPAEEVLWAEPLAVALRGLSRAGGSGLSSLLVLGGGSVGLCVVAAGLATGVADVALVEPRADRRAAAESLGARAVAPGERLSRTDHDAVVDSSGVPAALVAALQWLKPGARAVLLGLGDRPVPWPVGPVELVTSFAYTDDDFRAAVDHIVSRRVRLGRLVTHRYGLADTADAIRASAREPGVVKAAVFPGLDRA
ncbi:MAG TPA: alcohol dehydrogenase catalytic domain-containing protein [Egibacteraceae bacterium]|nr:alcohol dehydrogenase catalytic domain-containing protein [Egibacteraceae bacterium]